MLASNLAMGEGVAADFQHAPLSRLLLAITRAEFKGSRDHRDELQRAFLAIDPDDKHQEPYRLIVEMWISLDILDEPGIGNTVDPATPDQWASRLLVATRLRLDLYKIPHDLMPAIALRLAAHIERISISHRHAGRREDAERALRAAWKRSAGSSSSPTPRNLITI